MRIQLLLTGNEIMSGDIVDSNSAMVAEMLAPLGWRIHRKVTVGDELDLLCEEISHMCAAADVLIINGGLGPTVDDMTAAALARVSNKPLCEHPEALAELRAWCARLNMPVNDANYKQAVLPEGADIIRNGQGTAPGIRIEHQGCLVLATPGVPRELKAMMAEEILPLLEARFPSDHIDTRRMAVFGQGESTLQQKIAEQYPDWPDAIELGFRASMPALEVKLTARGESSAGLLDEWQNKLIDFLGEHYIGPAPTSLAKSLIEALAQQGLSACSAESCTGGSIAAAITAEAGASEVYRGGWVSYANSMKIAELAVNSDDLEREGAVSETVARQMLAGALSRSGADIGSAITGIAGPGGGSEEKPVGTVWLAWGRAENIRSRELHIPMPRAQFQQWVSALALDLMRREALGLDSEPAFLRRRRPRR